MPKIIILPIEPLPERYSADWITWFDAAMHPDDVMINPAPLTTKIESGSFLDVCGTNYYKAKQITELSRMIYEGNVHDGDTVLLLDGWFPGVESIAYMRDALGIRFNIMGCFHAGTYDRYDFLSKKNMGVWAHSLEDAWFSIYDKVFVATEFHKRLICSERDCPHSKVYVTGFPIYGCSVETDKQNIVVFPHRLDSEKCPDLFDSMRDILTMRHPDWSFVKSKDCCSNKQDYYRLLSRAKVSVSFALQETWGIAMQESVICGCVPVVPDRLSYAEMYPMLFRYTDFHKAVELTERIMSHWDEYKFYPELLGSKFLGQGHQAISNIFREATCGILRKSS